MFIERQSRRSSENNTELIWSSWEAKNETNTYRVQQHISYHQHPQYNERQKYRKNRSAPNASLYNAYKREKVDWPN